MNERFADSAQENLSDNVDGRLVIGTRGSKLALWQANHVKGLLEQAWPHLDVSIEVIHTTGDKILDTALSKIGDKGLFTKELEVALIDGRVDVCVHSMKDMPTTLPEGLRIAAMPPRADVRDVLIDFTGTAFSDLPAGTRVATGSLRRSAQLAAMRSDIELCEIRGNVDTRVGKVRDGQFDALVLAAAGVTRLGLTEGIVEYFEPNVMIPAVGQGAIGIEAHADDARTDKLLAPICCASTMRDVEAERYIMRALEGGCQVPMGAYARDKDGALVIDAFVGSLDGSRIVRSHVKGELCDSLDLAADVVRELRAQGAVEILEAIR